jgi:hypothetical protein
MCPVLIIAQKPYYIADKVRLSLAVSYTEEQKVQLLLYYTDHMEMLGGP